MQARLIPIGLIPILAVVLLPSGGYGQQKYRLRAQWAPGDLFTTDTTTDVSLKLTVSPVGSDEGTQQLPFTERDRTSYREKVLAVDDKGPSVIRRTYTIDRSVTTDPDLNETTKVSPLQGKTVTLRRTGDQVTVTAEGGELAPLERSALIREFSHPEDDFFPDREVAPGDEWPIDSHLLLSLFPGAKNAQARYQFQKVMPFAGHPCALIHVTAEVNGQVPGSPAPMTITLTGDLYRAIDLQQTLEDDDVGPITVQGQKVEKGLTLRFTGDGTLRVKQTAHWLMHGGRPVAAGAVHP